MKKLKINNTKILTKKKPEKKLMVRIKRTGGRGSSGRITVRGIGGGAKKMYRLVDFGQNKKDISAEVIALEYDPNRTAFIALVQYEDGEKRYVLAPKQINVGDKIITGEKVEKKIGNRMQIGNIAEGTDVFNVELETDKGGKIAKSAGSYLTIMAHDEGYTLLKMPSSEIRKVRSNCYATVGVVSNSEHRFINWEKAGKTRRKGRRPHVRGSAMNPCDHPHGGGEGKAPIGLKHPKTPWGKCALGVKTRKKKWSSKLIVKRRKTKR